MAEPKKPWSWRARIAAFPPIDWAALAQEQREASRWTRKGDKRPREDVEKKMAAYWRNRRAREVANLERAWRELARRRSKHRVFTLAHRIALAMAPGEWYGRADITRAARMSTNSTKARVGTMLADGLIERERNPDWKPAEFLPGEGVHEVPPERRSPPVWLYRLTEAGLDLRREAEWLQ